MAEADDDTAAEAGATPELRLSDADRDAVVARLSSAMAEGRLDPDEFAERSGAAYAARVPSDLEPLVVDLPPDAAAPPAPVPSRRVSNGVARSGGRRWILSLIGDRRRSGTWDPGAQTVAITIIGDQWLDCSEVDGDEIDLVSLGLIGDTHITVPASADVRFSGFSVLGDVDDDLGAPEPGPRRTVRIRSYGIIGDVRVRRAGR